MARGGSGRSPWMKSRASERRGISHTITTWEGKMILYTFSTRFLKTWYRGCASLRSTSSSSCSCGEDIQNLKQVALSHTLSDTDRKIYHTFVFKVVRDQNIRLQVLTTQHAAATTDINRLKRLQRKHKEELKKAADPARIWKYKYSCVIEELRQLQKVFENIYFSIHIYIMHDS